MDKSYKRKNNYYWQGGGGSNHWNSKKFKNYLQPGLKGFLCTCNTPQREKDCIKESYNILNEYADKLYGSVDLQPDTNTEKVEGSAGDAAGEIEDELKKEVSSLKDSQYTPGKFKTVDTGVKSNVFIKTTLDDPVKLAFTILTDIATTKTQKARFLLRIVPVEVTCKANLEDIKTTADALFDKHFRCEPTTFAIIINKRFNDTLLRDEVIKAVALLVTDKNREHKANLKEAKLTVLLEVMKGICCMSVLEDYKKLRHYNIAEVAKPEPTVDERLEPTDTEKPVEGGPAIEEDTGEDKESDDDAAEHVKSQGTVVASL